MGGPVSGLRLRCPAYAVPPSSSAVLLRPLPSSSAGRCPLRCPARRLLLLSAVLRRTAIPKSSLLLPDFNLQSMLCSIIPKDFREKIWRVGVKCRSLQSAPEKKREKKQSAVVRRNHLRTRAKALAFPSRGFLRDKNISEKIWREAKKCVLLHSLNGTRVL